MAFTKITAAGIGSTETVTLDGVAVINNESIGGNLTVTGNATIGGVLTYEDVTNVDSVGLITARNGIVVGSGITLSKDGDIFATGISTFSEGIAGDLLIDDKIVHRGDTNTAIRFSAADTVTVETGGSERFRVQDDKVMVSVDFKPDTDSARDLGTDSNRFANGYFDTLYGDGSNLTGMAAGGAFVKGTIGVTSTTPVGIETTTLARKDLTGPAGNTATGAGSSFHGAYMGDGFLSFNTEFSNPTGYYISTFTNSLVAGPMNLGSTLTIDGTFTII